MTTDPAREAVLERLKAAANHFTQREQDFVITGRYAEAEGAHKFALWCLRAYWVERDDPEPKPVHRA